MYSELKPDRILDTIARLEQRIGECFPRSGLSRVAAELGRLAGEAGPSAEWLRRPVWILRFGAAVGIVGILAIAIGLANLALRVSLRVDGLTDLLQASEAAVNEVILLSLAIFFLVSLETRVKRSRALAALHRLRSIVHIVDMHQLTKDPQDLLSASVTGQPSPKRTFTRLELARYLDFCTELLSLASKLAALHVQYLNDAVVLEAVNDIETLAASLSNKIWQKIMILDTMVPPVRGSLERSRSDGHPRRRVALPVRRDAPPREGGRHVSLRLSGDLDRSVPATDRVLQCRGVDAGGCSRGSADDGPGGETDPGVSRLPRAQGERMPVPRSSLRPRGELAAGVRARGTRRR